ncbi:hypothetical protein HY971_04520 [Candidatus Kaiserbacteria bacterium]|nr:hypothetical protein [Candidatus Kaiserbacteria bacterium]
MTKTTQKAHRSVLGGMAALIFLAVFLIAFNAYADGGAARDRGTSGRTTTPTPPPPPPPSPAPVPVPPSSNPSGGITNVTTGEVDSGGNTGGNVTTGDESVEITVVNIGPTNSSQSVIIPGPTPPPTPECDSRTRTGCETQGPDRTR